MNITKEGLEATKDHFKQCLHNLTFVTIEAEEAEDKFHDYKGKLSEAEAKLKAYEKE